jgi:hypothetical protein
VKDQRHGRIVDCLVLPGTNCDKVGLVYPADFKWQTHELDNRKLRVMVSVRLKSGEQRVVDPFDFRWSPTQLYEARLTGQWLPVSSPEHVYAIVNEGSLDIFRANDDILQAQPVNVVDKNLVECPSIVFVFSRSNEKQGYSVAKLLSDYFFGVPSQCIVEETYQKMSEKPDQ